MALRVLFDLRPLQSPSGKRGIGTYIRSLLGHLRSPDLSFTFLLWRDRERPHLPGFEGARVVEAPPPPRWWAGWLWDRWVLPRLNLPQVDLAHFSSPFELDLGWPSRGFPYPCLVTVHDLNLVLYRDRCLQGKYRILAPVYSWIGRELGRAQGLLADSHHTAADLRRFLVRAPNSWVSHLAADPVFKPMAKADQQRFRADQNLPEGYLLYVGGFDHRKNLEVVLAALARMDEPPLLVMAGGASSASDRRRMEELVRGSEEVAGRISWRHYGYLQPEVLAGLYGSASALVFPSFCEGFGLPILEAMACGTPVVCAGATALPEVGGEAALYFDPESPAQLIEALKKLKSRASDMRREGPRRAAEFTWAETARITKEAYLEVARTNLRVQA